MNAPATANIKSTSLAVNRSPVQRLTTMNSELTEGEKQHLQVMKNDLKISG